jgi:hypothetical protein
VTRFAACPRTATPGGERDRDEEAVESYRAALDAGDERALIHLARRLRSLSGHEIEAEARYRAVIAAGHPESGWTYLGRMDEAEMASRAASRTFSASATWTPATSRI